MKGPAPGSFHGGAIDVPLRSSVYFTFTFVRGITTPSSTTSTR